MIGLENIHSIGFEIEGHFKKTLYNELSAELADTSYNFHVDGSVASPDRSGIESDGDGHPVYLNRYVDENGNERDMRVTSNTEFVSPVFYRLPDFLDLLARFENGKNYLIARGAGLHVHIKGPPNKMANLFAVDFEKKLLALLLKLDPVCYKKRLNDNNPASYMNRYYAPYKTAISILEHYGDKYKTIARRNGHGTTELRLLTPCEHKVEIVRSVLELADKQMGKADIVAARYVKKPKARCVAAPEYSQVAVF